MKGDQALAAQDAVKLKIDAWASTAAFPLAIKN
jgi:hypothetical protein